MPVRRERKGEGGARGARERGDKRATTPLKQIMAKYHSHSPTCTPVIWQLFHHSGLHTPTGEKPPSPQNTQACVMCSHTHSHARTSHLFTHTHPQLHSHTLTPTCSSPTHAHTQSYTVPHTLTLTLNRTFSHTLSLSHKQSL